MYQRPLPAHDLRVFVSFSVPFLLTAETLLPEYVMYLHRFGTGKERRESIVYRHWEWISLDDCERLAVLPG
jgi:hypothetical protein